MKLFELFNSGEYDVTANGTGLFVAETTLSDGSVFELECRVSRGVWEILFTVDGSASVTSSGIEIEVFSVAIRALREFVAQRNPNMMTFSSAGSSRTSLYEKFISRFCRGYNRISYVGNGATNFFLYKGDIPVTTMNLDTAVAFQFPLFDFYCSVTIEGDKVSYKPALMKTAMDASKEVKNAVLNTLSSVSDFAVIKPLFEAKEVYDARMDSMPDAPFFPSKENPSFISKSNGFHFSYSKGVLILNSTMNSTYDFRALGMDERITSKLWNSFGGTVDFASKTVTIAKEDTVDGKRQRNAFDIKEIKKAFTSLMKYGVTPDFKIKGLANSEKTIGEFLEKEDAGEFVKQNTASKPITLYHGTSMKAWEEIQKNGLVPGKTGDTYVDLIPGYSEFNVYLAVSPKTSEFYGKRQAKKDGSDQYVVLEITVPDVAKILPDDATAYNMNGLTQADIHKRVKMSIDRDGSVAYRGAIRPSFIKLHSKKKA